MIPRNIHLAIQLVSLESFECAHKEVFFRVTIEEQEKKVCRK